MKILADSNILSVEQRFSRLGRLQLFDGRSLRREDLVGADALLVRSITPVDEALIAGTGVRFVGTATSGIDHIDTDYLATTGIGFAHARGSNANAVVDYCFAALAFATLHRGFSLPDSRVGIVGAGAVGAALAAKLEALGVNVLRCDPPLEIADRSGRRYSSLEETLACDVVSLHVPLIRSGSHPTLSMIGAAEIERLEGAVLINACRGSVVDESALKEALLSGAEITTVFDVWKNEPLIDVELLNLVDIATPHIAGYSEEAKLNATEMLAIACEKHFELGASDIPEHFAASTLSLQFDAAPDERLHWQTLLRAFPLEELSEQFRSGFEGANPATAFDRMRRRLRHRREFESMLLKMGQYSPAQRTFLSALGFRSD